MIWTKDNENLPLTCIVEKENAKEVNGAKQLLGSKHSSKYLPLCSAEEKKNSFRFATI